MIVLNRSLLSSLVSRRHGGFSSVARAAGVHRALSSSTTTTTPFWSSEEGKPQRASASSSTSDDPLAMPLTSLSLGLLPSFVSAETLASIRQLPEVQNVLRQQQATQPAQKQQQNSASSSSSQNLPATQQPQMRQDELLHRAIEIFERVHEGGKEHQALLALLAEFYQRHGNFDKAMETIRLLIPYVPFCEPDAQLRLGKDLALATAKVSWLQGEVEDALNICKEMMEDSQLSLLPLHHAAARNGYALSKLLMAQTLDDCFSLRDPSRMVLKFLQKNQQHLPPLAVPMALLNFGNSEIVYAQLISRLNNVDAPLDGAMRAWMEGLTLLDQQSSATSTTSNQNILIMTQTLRARFNANMAWGTLEMKAAMTKKAQIRKASDYAGKALKSAEQIMEHYNRDPSIIDPLKPEGFGRILSLVALCYQKNGQAVTAEGLLQTAMDDLWTKDGSNTLTSAGPQQVIDQREILLTYSRLLQAWDKREAEGKSLEEDVVQLVDNQLKAILSPLDDTDTQHWLDKPPIFASLWFWTPNEFMEKH